MTPRRDPRAFVEDILEAIANIEADTDGLDFNQFAADRRVRQLVERNVEIISEAAAGCQSRPRRPSRIFRGARSRIGNILRHDYGIVRPEILWGIRAHRLTGLKRAWIGCASDWAADIAKPPEAPRNRSPWQRP